MKQNTCILLFSRTAVCESKHKQLVNAEHTNVKLHDALYTRTLNTISKVGLPIIKIDESRQVGNSFGEKFSNAISFAFSAGFEHVITVGSDCPALREDDIAYAYEELQAGRQVVGPSNDGGIYLLGISKSYLGSDFQNLAWQTDKLYSELYVYFTEFNACVVDLVKKLDVDTATQFNAIAHFLIKQIGFDFLLDIQVKVIFLREVLPLKEYKTIGGHTRRGPPSLHLAA